MVLSSKPHYSHGYRLIQEFDAWEYIFQLLRSPIFSEMQSDLASSEHVCNTNCMHLLSHSIFSSNSDGIASDVDQPPFPLPES